MLFRSGAAQLAEATASKNADGEEQLEALINALPTTSSVGWLRIDAKPIKQALGSWVSRWSYCYTEHLLNRVTDTVSELLSCRTERKSLTLTIAGADDEGSAGSAGSAGGKGAEEVPWTVRNYAVTAYALLRSGAIFDVVCFAFLTSAIARRATMRRPRADVLSASVSAASSFGCASACFSASAASSCSCVPRSTADRKSVV